MSDTDTLPATTVPSGVDLDRPYELDPQVALRPEPFGALAYHYGNRRLTFLRSPRLVALVEALAAYPTLGDALQGCGIEDESRGAVVRALGSLESSEVIRAR